METGESITRTPVQLLFWRFFLGLSWPLRQWQKGVVPPLVPARRLLVLLDHHPREAIPPHAHHHHHRKDRHPREYHLHRRGARRHPIGITVEVVLLLEVAEAHHRLRKAQPDLLRLNRHQPGANQALALTLYPRAPRQDYRVLALRHRVPKNHR